MADNLDEIFDVVDENDRVVGQAPRGRVHAEGLLHRAVHILVQRDNGDIFLQQRSMEKDCHPGCWDSSSSGHLDSGEGYDEAAVREVREELGIEVEALTFMGSLPASEMTGQEFVRIYLATHGGPFTLHPGEISGGQWVTVGQLQDWLKDSPKDFAPCFHEVWNAVEGRFA